VAQHPFQRAAPVGRPHSTDLGNPKTGFKHPSEGSRERGHRAHERQYVMAGLVPATGFPMSRISAGFASLTHSDL
jgi:hypothetical protein